MGRLDGKVALISGGARGQGACEARMFCREGAQVVFGDILDAEGKAIYRGGGESGGGSPPPLFISWGLHSVIRRLDAAATGSIKESSPYWGMCNGNVVRDRA